MSELVATLLKWAASIIAVAAAFGVGYLVFGVGNAGNHVADLGTLAGDIKTLYQGQPTFSSVTTAIAYKTAPARMKSTTVGTLINPWGGPVTVTADASPAQFDIETDQIPDDQCAKVATTPQGFVSVTVNGTPFTASSGIDAGLVTQACGVGTDQNTIKFVFGH
jgi:hypothetical protein